MPGNLPDDVLPGDIDDKYGEPDHVWLHGTVEVAVSVEVPAYLDSHERTQRMRDAVENGEFVEIVDAEIGEIEHGY